jgi:hypothetical protein
MHHEAGYSTTSPRDYDTVAGRGCQATGGGSANQSYYIQRYSAIQSYPYLLPWSREKGEINRYELYMRMLFSLLADIIPLVPTFR